MSRTVSLVKLPFNNTVCFVNKFDRRNHLKDRMINVDLEQNLTKNTKIKTIRRFTVIAYIVIKNSIVDLHNFN